MVRMAPSCNRRFDCLRVAERVSYLGSVGTSQEVLEAWLQHAESMSPTSLRCMGALGTIIVKWLFAARTAGREIIYHTWCVTFRDIVVKHRYYI